MPRSALHSIALLIAASSVAACTSRPSPNIGPALPHEPDIRVRVRAGEDALDFQGPQALLISPALPPAGAPRSPGGSDRPAPAPESFEPPLTLVHRNDRWHVNDRAMLRWQGPLVVEHPDGEPVPLGDRLYPGRLVLVPRADLTPAQGGRDRFDVVNHVHLEAYLPGVLDKELYPNWRPTTFYAQAIAARSYAIHRMLNATAERHYDVEADQTSQAYIGATDNLRAMQAVLETTGLVLTHNRTVLQALYSSTCGGAGASPTDAFGGPTHQAPLIPVERAAWCRASKHFSWGPIRRDRRRLALRFAAWGRAHRHSLADLKAIRSIAVAERNAVGRPAMFVITDEAGPRHRLAAEPFRAACNFVAPGLPKRGPRLKSAFVEPVRLGNQVAFRAGHGFGHGVGLCQFGAQAMAVEGHDVMEILATYYPGAHVRRAY